MATKSEKPLCPPTVSYKSFTSFLNQLREHGTIPTRVDKTLMPKASGSQSSATLATLKYLELIDEAGKPSKKFESVVLANDDGRKPMLAELLKQSYAFIFTDEEFDLEKASSGEMTEKFRKLDLSGSTVTKTIAFFLAAAKDAGIKVSTLIKPPPAPKSNGAGRKASKVKDEGNRSQDESDADDENNGDVERFEIPVPGKSSVKVIVPNDLDADDWEMLQSMITVYIKRWKGFKDKKNTE